MYRRLRILISGFVLGILLIIISPFFSPWITHHADLALMADDQINLNNNSNNYHYPISTQSDLAQQYFDRGLALAYGFNHAQASIAFENALKADPNCVMCYWGLAYVLGPNINVPMNEEQVPSAWQAIQKAIAISEKGSKKEQAYVQALAKRYSKKPVEDRSPLDMAYAKAMGKIVQDYPDDLDAATLYAEALMDTMPWDYWQDNGELKPEAKPIAETLESVLQRNPKHAGANHFYIHTMEKEHPQLAIDAADNLRDLMPNSGHLQHMPSHIYIRVGRYEDAVIANQKAIKADMEYLASSHPDSVYKFVYVPHNYHFLWFSALMTGQSKIAAEAALKTADVNPALIRQPDVAGALQHYLAIPLYTKVRFGEWDEILNTPAPETDLKYPNGVWHYARGMAFVAKANQEKANQELSQLQALVSDSELQELKIWGFNSTANVLAIASEVLQGAIANSTDNYNQAVNHFQKAITLEDDLIYTEPPDWYSPSHNLLGEIHLQNNRLEEAEKEFNKDLEIYPENGWSLHGLAQSLQKQGKLEQAKTVQQQYEKAWQYADFTL